VDHRQIPNIPETNQKLPPELACKHRRPGNLIRATAAVRVASVVVDVDLDAGVVGSIRPREANKVLARVGARAGDADSGGETGQLLKRRQSTTT